MGPSVIWKERAVRDKTPRTIEDIVRKGSIHEEFNLGILRDTRTTARTVIFEFELKTGESDPIRYDASSALSSEAGQKNIKMLEKHHSYIVKGDMEVYWRNKNYDKLSRSNSLYEIFMERIEIIAKNDASLLSKQTYVTVDELWKYILTRKYGKFDLQNIRIVDGELYRYWGCDRCTKSIFLPINSWGRYPCTSCNPPFGVEGRICTIARNIKIQDDNFVQSQMKTISGLIIFHSEVERMLGEAKMAQICTSLTDEKAKHEFHKLLGKTFNCDITHQEPYPTSRFRNASVTLKNIRWTTPTNIVPGPDPEAQSDPDADEDDSPPKNVVKPTNVLANNGQDIAEISSAGQDKHVANIICKDCKEIDDNENDEDDGIDSDHDHENEHPHENGPTAILGPSNNLNFRQRTTSTTMNSTVTEENMDCDPESEAGDSGICDIDCGLEGMSLSRTYQLSGSKAGPGHYGLAMIINIDSEVRQKKRPGSLNDVAALEKVFPALKIDLFQGGAIHNPSLENNKRYDQVFSNALQEFKAELIRKDYQSCFVVYMGHGEQNVVMLGDGKTINVYKDIMWEFSEKQFRAFGNKPKIFIFAACQGVPENPEGFKLDTSSPMANMLWVTPSLPGQASKRHTVKGTYFIQKLVLSLRTFRTRPLSEILFEMQNSLKYDVRDKGYFIPNVHNRCFKTFLFPTGQGNRLANR